jgi:hypothetical protein
MRLTIIPIDGAVYVDGVCFSGLLLEGIPSDVHALQWFDTKGWIEYSTNPFSSEKKPNEEIEELPDWANLAISSWEEANSNQQQAILNEGQ